MYAKELLAAAPTADALLALTDKELQLLLLKFIREANNDTPRRPTTCDGTVDTLFSPPSGYELKKRDDVWKAVRRAWRTLEEAELIEWPDPTNGKNGYRIVSAKGMNVDTHVDLAKVSVRAWLTPELAHPRLRGACLNAFRSGDYDTAVYEAFKAVEATVRKKGGYKETDYGVKLMEKAFDPANGPLTDQSMPMPRRRARQKLFEGALGELRNPRAHGDPQIDDPQIAIEEILAASALLRIIG
jgi:uncharacterized protein (TIGR02391 family)